MALWHDPLEELIAGLERALPAETWSEIVPYEVFCLATDVLLYGTPDEQRAFEKWKAFDYGERPRISGPSYTATVQQEEAKQGLNQAPEGTKEVQSENDNRLHFSTSSQL